MCYKVMVNFLFSLHKMPCHIGGVCEQYHIHVTFKYKPNTLHQNIMPT